MAIFNDTQRAYVGEVVTLFQLDCTSLGGEVLFFTSTAEAGGEAEVVFDGNTYTAVEIDADGFEYNGRGAFPTPTLRLSNVTSVATGLVLQYRDLLGAKVIRIRTLKTYLDNGDTPDPTQIFTPDIYIIEQKTAHNRRFIEWKLAAAVDQQGQKLPSRQLVRDYCDHTYRVWDPVNSEFNYNHATCPYNDVAMYDVTNTVTLDPTLDRCAKNIPACKARFGDNGDLPSRACPGLGRFR